ERLVTARLAVSTVVKRRPHSGHCRRRRIEAPSSVARLSTTRLSVWRQNGQCIGATSSAENGDLWTQLWIRLGETCGPSTKAGDYMWITTSMSFTRCRGYLGTPPPHVQEVWPSRWP